MDVPGGGSTGFGATLRRGLTRGMGSAGTDFRTASAPRVAVADAVAVAVADAGAVAVAGAGAVAVVIAARRGAAVEATAATCAGLGLGSTRTFVGEGVRAWLPAADAAA